MRSATVALVALAAVAALVACNSTSTTISGLRTGLLPGQQTGGTIYSFNWTNPPKGGQTPSPSNDGQEPKGTLAYANGVLYGRTAAGGFSHSSDNGCGTVFSVLPGGAAYQVLYRFNADGSGSDGCNPRHDAPVIYQNALYATNLGVSNGTASNSNGVSYGTGNGVIFSLPASPGSNRGHDRASSFTGAAPDGGMQHSSFSIDSTGLFYGMSAKGGSKGKGQIYSLRGTTYAPLYDFSDSAPEGKDPHGRIVLVNGVLYGVTREGGSGGGGTVFSFVPSSSAPVVLHAFNGGPNDGFETDHGYVIPTIDANGNTVLYGMTTCGGGTTTQPSSCTDGDPGAGYGVIYQVTLASGVSNPFSLVYAFKGASDGANPYGSLLLDPTGKTLYGMAAGGGSAGKGTVFSVPVTPFGMPATPTTLWSFMGSNVLNGGEKPIDNVIFVPLGSSTMLCGMTVYGGNPNASADGSNHLGDGTVFCIPSGF